MSTDTSLPNGADAVLIPELGSPHVFRVTYLDDNGTEGELNFKLRPLPIKQAKILNSLISPLEKLGGQPDESTVSQVDIVTDVYETVAAHLFSFYGQTMRGKEWIEEHLQFSDVQRLIELQLEEISQHDFTVALFRRTFSIVKGLTTAMTALTPGESLPLMSSSTPVSLKVGDSTPSV